MIINTWVLQFNVSYDNACLGAGIYVSSAYYGYAGRQAAQPANTYINVDSGSSYINTYRFRLYCCSNSTASYVGSITDPRGSVYTGRFNDLSVTRYSTGSSYTGCIQFHGYERYSSFSYTSGVYTCNIPDANGQTQNVNFALYGQSCMFIMINSLKD
jgi:hypothetical protein